MPTFTKFISLPCKGWKSRDSYRDSIRKKLCSGPEPLSSSLWLPCVMGDFSLLKVVQWHCVLCMLMSRHCFELASNNSSQLIVFVLSLQRQSSCIWLSWMKKKKPQVIKELIPKYPPNYGIEKCQYEAQAKIKKKDDNLFGEIFWSVWWCSCLLPSNKATRPTLRVGKYVPA